jgi:chemosensory pili system protein ChpA (sensor histidine kinase/response regulator)
MATHERPTVLLVEDDRATREMYEYALRLAGFAVKVAADGLTALRFLEQDIPDVMVLDLDLPHVSGSDVQQEVVAHAETSAIPIVVVTGTEWNAPAGVVQVLRKPITTDALIDAVQRAISPPDDPSGGTSRRRSV